jgi:hypothetical protein
MSSIRASQSMALRVAALECWPKGTVQTRDDVIVDGLSLAAAAAEGHTPLVRIGPATASFSATPQRFITVLLCRVERIGHAENSRRPQLWVDAELDHCELILSAARLVGREGAARRRRMELCPRPNGSARWIRLPIDIAAGDVVAVPCEGTTPLSDVRRHPHPSVRLGRAHGEQPDDDFPRCGK